MARELHRGSAIYGYPPAMQTNHPTHRIAIQALDDEHEAMARMLTTCPTCRLPLGDRLSRRSDCQYGKECGASIRKILSELVLASIAHFDHEVDVLRHTVCREDFEAHTREHVRLTEMLTSILAEYTEHRDCIDAIDRIMAFAKAISAHMAGTDAPMLKTRPPVYQ